MKKKYMLYFSAKKCIYYFFEEGDTNSKKMLDEDATLIWSTTAVTMEDAHKKRCEFLGEEPCMPVEENLYDKKKRK